MGINIILKLLAVTSRNVEINLYDVKTKIIFRSIISLESKILPLGTDRVLDLLIQVKRRIFYLSMCRDTNRRYCKTNR